MQRLNLNLRHLAAVLVAGCVALTAVAVLAETDSSDARKERILANLKLQFPQLENLNVAIGDLEPSGYDGLDQGAFTLTAQGNQQTQSFLVSSDNKKLYLVSGEPIDVSRSTEEIQAEVAKREEEAAQKAAELRKQLEESIAGEPVRGNPEATVTIVEFSDFQCPYCARGTQTMDDLLEKYPGEVKLVFKHFPLGFHPWAKPAAIASHCAAEQNADAFWTLHDQYFANQKAITPENVIAKSKEFLAASEIDMGQWAECAEKTDSEAHKAAAAAVEADMALGSELGVSGTPGFFVNGEFINGAQPITAFEPLIEKAKMGS